MAGSAAFGPEGPTFLLTTLEDSRLAAWFNRATAARRDAAIRRVRGRLSETVPGFWDEAAAALQFPYYFTVGWPGFSDCVRDLAWLPADSYVVLVCDAPRLFVAEPEELDDEWSTLVATLERARGYWQDVHVRSDGGPDPRPFRVVLQCTEETAGPLIDRIESAGGSIGRWSPDDA